MTQYWANAKLLFERYAELDSPALVHLEPDFWAYAQQKSGGDPASVSAHLSPECSDLPADLTGMARCWFKLALCQRRKFHPHYRDKIAGVYNRAPLRIYS